MRCVVGLGNPGNEYAMTRHNIGFIILDSFAIKHKLNFRASKMNFYKSEGSLGSSDFFLIKPTTYMNLSGAALLDFISTNNIHVEDILVVYDDVNLPIGKIRLRKFGSDGGHNGIKSIIYHLQNNNFPRLRFGIGSDFTKGEMADYVLSKFSDNDKKIIVPQIDFSIELIEKFILHGYQSMADLYARILHEQNKSEKTPPKSPDKEENSENL